MLSIFAAALVLSFPPLPNRLLTPVDLAAAPTTIGGEHGKLPWFEGAFDDAIKEAKSKNQLVFVDLWTTWCGWCKRLDSTTYTDDSVAAEMKDFVCFNIDAESKPGVPLARRFNVRGYPALIILNADGTYRDQIGGYLNAEDFKREIKRVRSGKGTVTGLRQEVEADKSNIEKRSQLANKLKEIGDKAGADEQMAAIQKLDPDGKSLPMHQLAFEKLIETISDGWQKSHTLDMAAMQSFLEKETYSEILFQGWNSMMKMQDYLAGTADQENKPDEAKKLRGDLRRSMAQAWKYCPAPQMAGFGHQMASGLYADKDNLEPADKTLALEMARKVQSLQPDDVAVLDLVACCQFMNGEKDEALKTNARCIELDPKNAAWQARKTEFSPSK
jgi:thioredoxin-related protein